MELKADRQETLHSKAFVEMTSGFFSMLNADQQDAPPIPHMRCNADTN